MGGLFIFYQNIFRKSIDNTSIVRYNIDKIKKGGYNYE